MHFSRFHVNCSPLKPVTLGFESAVTDHTLPQVAFALPRVLALDFLVLISQTLRLLLPFHLRAFVFLAFLVDMVHWRSCFPRKSGAQVTPTYPLHSSHGVRVKVVDGELKGLPTCMESQLRSTTVL